MLNPPGPHLPPASSIAPGPPFLRRAAPLEALGAAQGFGGREEGVGRGAGEGAQEGPGHLGPWPHGTSIAGWFIRENAVPLFQETSI